MLEVDNISCCQRYHKFRLLIIYICCIFCKYQCWLYFVVAYQSLNVPFELIATSFVSFVVYVYEYLTTWSCKRSHFSRSSWCRLLIYSISDHHIWSLFFYDINGESWSFLSILYIYHCTYVFLLFYYLLFVYFILQPFYLWDMILKRSSNSI